jgi:hypothetical protein
MLSFYPAVDTGFRLWGCELAQELAVRGRMGLGSATLNGEPLYSDYQIHFMVTQGMRGRGLVVRYPFEGKTSPAGAVNPALQQLDFYIRSPEENSANHPNREVLDHFFAMEVTWK